MGKIQVLTQTPMNIAELKETLENIKQRDSELSIRSQKTYEYITILPMAVDKVAEIIKEIEALNVPRLKTEYIIKITNIMPASVEELKLVLQGYGLTVSNDNLEKIMKILTGKNES